MPLSGNDSYKIGLGLWNYPIVSHIVEGIILLGGLWIYMKSTTGTTFGGRVGMIIFAVFLLTANMVFTFGPPPPSAEFAAVQMLLFYLLFVGIAFWLDRKRN